MLYQSLFDEIDRQWGKKKHITVAIDGNSGAGKSSLSDILKERYSCNVISMDDFFLRPEQRTSERFAQPGGNIDYERFIDEVIIPLKSDEAFEYHPFDCKTMTLSNPISVIPTRLTVVEGVYCLHPQITSHITYDIAVFLSIENDEQQKRLLKRNPQLYERFINEWIPLENAYFHHFDIKSKCNFIFDVTTQK